MNAQIYTEPFLADEKKKFASIFSIYIIKRMLEILQENGRIKRTQLAGKTGLNYNKCIKYINLLKILGWVDVIFDETYYVAITQSGKDTTKSLSDI